MSDGLFVYLFILRISKKFRKNKNDESERAATFEEFLKYFVDKDEVMNEVWMTLEEILNPCQYEYDFILKIENVESETKWIFDKFAISDSITFPDGNTNPATMKELEQQIQTIPKKLIEKVRQKLYRDYALFNYPLPDFLSNKELL